MEFARKIISSAPTLYGGGNTFTSGEIDLPPGFVGGEIILDNLSGSGNTMRVSTINVQFKPFGAGAQYSTLSGATSLGSLGDSDFLASLGLVGRASILSISSTGPAPGFSYIFGYDPEMFAKRYDLNGAGTSPLGVPRPWPFKALEKMKFDVLTAFAGSTSAWHLVLYSYSMSTTYDVLSGTVV